MKGQVEVIINSSLGISPVAMPHTQTKAYRVSDGGPHMLSLYFIKSELNWMSLKDLFRLNRSLGALGALRALEVITPNIQEVFASAHTLLLT